MKASCTKLHPVSLGLAFGILWSISLVIVTILAMLYAYGTPFVALLGSVYIGYEATLLGTLIGAVWAFLDGFIGGLLLAWLYNLCLSCCCKYCDVSSE